MRHRELGTQPGSPLGGTAFDDAAGILNGSPIAESFAGAVSAFGGVGAAAGRVTVESTTGSVGRAFATARLLSVRVFRLPRDRFVVVEPPPRSARATTRFRGGAAFSSGDGLASGGPLGDRVTATRSPGCGEGEANMPPDGVAAYM